MSNHVDITVLLDRSGSMNSIKLPMQNAFNEFVDGHKANPSTRLTLVEFDEYYTGQERVMPNFLQPSVYNMTTQIETRYTALPIGNVPPLELQPRGNTPLIDAICETVDKTGTRLKAMPVADRPTGVLFIIITDGYENASRRFTRADARKRIEHQTNDYKWEFLFMGANQDALKEAATYGIELNKSITFANSTLGTSGSARSMTANTVAYAASAGSGRADRGTLPFTVEQRVAAAGDDEDLKKKARAAKP